MTAFLWLSDSVMFYVSVRNSLDLALSRPVTALDNERFTVQSIIAKYACPAVLVRLSLKNASSIYMFNISS